MSPLNRGPLMGPRMPPVGMRPPLPPPPRFGRVPMPGMPPRMAPPPHSMGAMFGPMRPRMPPRLANMMRPGGPPPLFGPRNRGPPPLMLPMMGPRGMGPRGPPMRPGPRGILPPQVLPHMRPRFPSNNSNIKSKAMSNSKKVSKLEERELTKPWMTDEIRSEIQKKNKLYAKTSKNKGAKEWEEFKDLRNKVTRMIRDAKNEYLTKHPELAALYEDEPEYFDDRDENDAESEIEDTYYCEMCDREFPNEKLLDDHNQTHKICGIDGCTFSAHPKLIEKHISMQHRTGLYHKLKNLSTPEEITKWIEERKRKYPTKSCIEFKKAATLEKQERGEIIEKDRPGKTPNNSKRQSLAKSRRIKKSQRLPQNKISEEIDVGLYRGVRSFLGTKNLDLENTNNANTSIHPSDDDEGTNTEANRISDEEEVQMPNAAPVNTFNSISSLVADYESDMDNDGPEEIPVKRMKMDIEPNKSPPAEDESTLLKDSSPTSSSVPSSKPIADLQNGSKSLTLTSKKDIKSQSVIPNNREQRDKKQKKRHMLLQRLLSRSIVHERNFICQCIKYIQDNNFFTSEQETTTT